MKRSRVVLLWLAAIAITVGSAAWQRRTGPSYPMRGSAMLGGETIAYEWIPAGRGHALLPVHRILLVESGIHIVEAMNLGNLADLNITEFLFVMTPLKIVGATGVPVRPIAIA